RDRTVTGVQTCALPILGFAAVFHAQARGRLRRFELGAYSKKNHQLCQLVDGVWGRDDGMWCLGEIEFNRWYDVRVQVRGSTCSRSEERRVGIVVIVRVW